MSEVSPWRAALPNRAAAVRFGLSLLGLVVVAGVLGYLLRAPLTALGRLALETFGLWGLFGGVLFTDSWIFPPLTHEPVQFLAIAADQPFLVVWLVSAAASLAAGYLGYGLGFLLGRVRKVKDRLENSALAPMMRGRPATTVFVAALTPVPFALATWTSGALGLPLWRFSLGCLGRIPKAGIYLGLIALGWQAGAG